VPYRAEMESAFGQDFSGVKAQTGAHAEMQGIGARAAAQGDNVAFAESNPSKWLVAHELTHVAQARQFGEGAFARKPTIAAIDSAAEHEADSVADRVTRGEEAGAITAAPEARIHRFAPDGHRAATVSGLSGSFSAEEIGDVYASNWERDFSQGNGDIASAALAWINVKNYAAKNKGAPGPTAAPFRAAIWKVVNGSITSAMDESLGGYKYWEHMDHPTKTDPDAPAPPEGEKPKKLDQTAEERWAKHGNGLAGYLSDSRAHIKDSMVAAVNVFREQNKLGQVGTSIDNWDGAAKPGGYVDPKVSSGTGGKVTSTLPKGYDDKGVASRNPVREETKTDATAAGAKSNPKHDEKLWQLIGQHLGRAMHAFEDFWAHSNWLEMAKIAGQRADRGEKPATGAAENAKLKTGTFEEASQIHALGHKLFAMASAFQKDFPLLLKVNGRKSGSTKLEGKKANTTRSTEWGGGLSSGKTDHDMAYGPLDARSWTLKGEAIDVAEATNNVEELVLSGQYTMADFLTDESWLQALRQKGLSMIEHGDKKSDANAHGKLAKDQNEAGAPSKDYDTALALAQEGDKQVFGPLRATMDEKDPVKAEAQLKAQLALVDTMLQVPSPAHPLWGLVNDHPLPGQDGPIPLSPPGTALV
jgi:hypothetical protein